MAANDNPALNPETDPEIAALLDFEPVPRAYKQKGAWTPELQRLFIARLAVTGSINKACDQINKDPGGARKLLRAPGGEGFRAAADAAEALWESRNVPPPEVFAEAIPGPGRRRRGTPPPQPLPGQVMNELGEWEHPDSIARRAEEAKDSISMKLRNCRRLFLADISGSPGKRAAFEILTEYEVDWEKAARLEMQADEPWKRFNMREADMILTCENGWHAGMAWGEDKMRELRDALDEHRAAEGLPPIEWGDETAEPSDAD